MGLFDRIGLLLRSNVNAAVSKAEDPEKILEQLLIDMRAAGVDIATVGQYLRPTNRHLPVARWWTPEEFADIEAFGMSLGFAHVQSSPLTRSSYHAKGAANAAQAVTLTGRR